MYPLSPLSSAASAAYTDKLPPARPAEAPAQAGADTGATTLTQADALAIAAPPQSELPEPLQFGQPATAASPAETKGPAKGTANNKGGDKAKGPAKGTDSGSTGKSGKTGGQAKVVKNGPKPNTKPESEPVKAPEPPAPPKVDPDEGLEKPPRLTGSGRAPEKEDDAVYETYLSLQRELRDELKAAGSSLSDGEKKTQLLDRMLLRLGGEDYTRLPDDLKASLRSFTAQFDFKDLVLAEVQSAGGADAVEGIVTGTGVDGHYTSSMLRSLQGLMAGNRLTPELLSALDTLRQAPLHADLAPQAQSLLRSTLQELAFPERIEQHSKGTCAPTTVQIVLALRDPVKYARIVTALASPEGKVPVSEMNNQGALEREADTLKDDRSGRSLSSRLLQPALMEFGNGEQNYDNAKDRNSDGKAEYAGLDEHGSIRLLEGLFGKGSYALRYTHANPEPHWQGFVKPETLMREIETALSQGMPVPVGMRWGETAHKVLLTKIDHSSNQAYLINPWGELQSMPLETLRRRMDAASLPKLPGKTQEALATLPGKASQIASYEPISSWRYYKITDYLLEDPSLKSLSDSRKDMLREKFRTLKLSADYASRQMDVLSRLTKAGLADEALYSRIAGVRDKDELSAVVRLYATFDKLPQAQFTSLLAAEPDKHLDPVWYAMLMDDITKPEVFTPLLARAQARQAAVADGSAQAKDQTQAGIKDAFAALTPGDLKAFKPLAAEADEANRGAMLKTLSESWPPGAAEDAADLLLAGLDGMQLKYIQQTLDPPRLVVGSDDAVRHYLRNQVRVAARTRAAKP